MAVDALTRLQHRDRGLQCISPRAARARPRLGCKRQRADCRMMLARILACRQADLAFALLITTLRLGPLVSSNAQCDMGLSSGAAGSPNTTSSCNHAIIVVFLYQD